MLQSNKQCVVFYFSLKPICIRMFRINKIIYHIRFSGAGKNVKNSANLNKDFLQTSEINLLHVWDMSSIYICLSSILRPYISVQWCLSVIQTPHLIITSVFARCWRVHLCVQKGSLAALIIQIRSDVIAQMHMKEYSYVMDVTLSILSQTVYIF